MPAPSTRRRGTTATRPALLRFDASAVTDTGEITGYGSVWHNLDSYGDWVEPGAFARSIAAHTRGDVKVKMLNQHDVECPIGVWDHLEEDGTGLLCRGRLLLDVQAAREAHALIKAGALDGLSIGFEIREGGSEFVDPADLPPYVTGDIVDTHPNGQMRCVTDIDLWEVSVVTFPSNAPSTIHSVRRAPVRGRSARRRRAALSEPVVAALARRQAAVGRLLG